MSLLSRSLSSKQEKSPLIRSKSLKGWGKSASQLFGKKQQSSDSVKKETDCSTWATLADVPSEDWMRSLELIKRDIVANKESFRDRLDRYLIALTVDTETQQRMTASFVHELQVGLELHRKDPDLFCPETCSFKMLDSCVPRPPSGTEKGIYYALDFGGTNFRAVRCDLKGDGTMTVSQLQRSLLKAPIMNRTSDSFNSSPTLLDATATATEMFDFFANVVKEFMIQQGDLNPDVTQISDDDHLFNCGFTFSYPCSQVRVDRATLICWTKGFETGRQTDDPVEGRDICELMNVAFVRNNVPMHCSSVLNDTVGTLLACSYEQAPDIPRCLVGLIMGTGLNACYWDPSAQARYGYRGSIINVECGNLNRDLPRTNVDCELDFRAVANRGSQQLEKMCSGAYLGEVARGIIVKVFQVNAPPLAWTIDSLPTEAVAAIAGDRSIDYSVTNMILREKWAVTMDVEQLSAVRDICLAVMDRAAALASVIIAACAIKTGRLQKAFGGVSIGIDGSLYKKNAFIQTRIRQHLESNLGKTRASLIHLLLADDGSGKGAAVLAATLS